MSSQNAIKKNKFKKNNRRKKKEKKKKKTKKTEGGKSITRKVKQCFCLSGQFDHTPSCMLTGVIVKVQVF